MRGYDIRKHAAEMGVMVQSAATMRIRFLVDEVAEYTDIYQETGCEVAREYAFRAVDELAALKRMAKDKPKQSIITDEMIELARKYPIDRLIEFRRGKAQAWCHEDNNPSLFHATRTNQVCCPVCHRYFDSIAVLMERDGVDFVDAVKQLQ